MAWMWSEPTEEEQRGMTRAILEVVRCDPDQGLLIALKPKPASRILFRQMRGLVERSNVLGIIC